MKNFALLLIASMTIGIANVAKADHILLVCVSDIGERLEISELEDHEHYTHLVSFKYPNGRKGMTGGGTGTVTESQIDIRTEAYVGGDMGIPGELTEVSVVQGPIDQVNAFGKTFDCR